MASSLFRAAPLLFATLLFVFACTPEVLSEPPEVEVGCPSHAPQDLQPCSDQGLRCDYGGACPYYVECGRYEGSLVYLDMSFGVPIDGEACTVVDQQCEYALGVECKYELATAVCSVDETWKLGSEQVDNCGLVVDDHPTDSNNGS